MNPKTTLRSLGYSVLALLFCSCAATSVKQTWKSPQYHGAPITKLAVLAVDERGMLRQAFENRFVSQLRAGGATALTTFNLLSLPEINRDKPAAAERLRAAGAEAVVILRLTDMANVFHDVRPSREAYAEYVNGFETGPWYDYYSVAFMDMSPTYGSSQQRVYLETSIFDLKTTKRLWSALSETKVTDTMDRVAEMDPIVAKFVMAMRTDGMVP